ncbi:hypothetical protein [Halorubrum saccharovorum]|uniref:hypothetical protein n=1 Tax=Halorubrum saccharovorum TaxID=2248 RepID=UPI001F3F66B6|nr:hypothetical protein [Halorubrum saccharovorum]
MSVFDCTRVEGFSGFDWELMSESVGYLTNAPPVPRLRSDSIVTASAVLGGCVPLRRSSSRENGPGSSHVAFASVCAAPGASTAAVASV